MAEGSKMKLGLINSAWVQTNKPLEFGLRETKRIGFDTVDLFIDPLDTDRSTRAGILRGVSNSTFRLCRCAALLLDSQILIRPSVDFISIEFRNISRWRLSIMLAMCCW